MNKKFITLCVSALLAGGMVTPAFAANNVAQETVIPAISTLCTSPAGISENQSYLIKLNATSSTNIGWTLHLTNARAWTANDSEVSQYTLWKVKPVKLNGVVTDQFELVNAAGLKLSADDKGNVGGQRKIYVDKTSKSCTFVA